MSSGKRTQSSCPRSTGCNNSISLLEIPEILDPPSGLSHYLRTNDIPHPALCDHISSYIQHETARLKAIEENIARIPRILQLLRKMRRHSHTSLEGFRSVTSPVRCLPVELLDRIFYFACRDAFSLEDDRSIRNFGANTAWIISRVCRRWKDVIDCSKHTLVVVTDVAHVRVERSRDRGFSIILLQPHYHRQSMPYKFFDVLPIFLANSAFWEKLTIWGTQTLLDVSKALRGHVHSVQELVLKDIDHLEFRESPAFIKLSSPPLHQIRNFRASTGHPSSTLYDVWDILPSMTHLETCTLDGNFLEELEEPGSLPDYSDLPPLTLSTVTTFGVSIYAKSILSHLSLPSLQNLRLESFNCEDFQPDDDFTLDPLSGFLSRSSTMSGGLKGLHLDQWDTQIDYDELLQALPELLELRLDWWYYGTEYCEPLEHYINDPSKHFLPNLQELNFAGESDLDWHDCERLIRRVKEARPGVQCTFEIV